MAQDEFSEKNSNLEISRAKRLSKATKDLRERALALAKHLESEEVPDVKDIVALHRKLTGEEKRLAKLLKPVPKPAKKKR